MLYGGGEEARSTSAERWISSSESVCGHANAILRLVCELCNSLSCPEPDPEYHQRRITIGTFMVSFHHLSDFPGIGLFDKGAGVTPALRA